MADAPEMPDLKKAQENKPAGFAWAPVAKAAASAVGRPAAPPSKGRGTLAAAAGLLVVGGLAFAYAAFRFGGSTDGSAGGAKLGGVASSMKIRFARQGDPTGNVVRERASPSGDNMRFDLIKGAADKAAADKAAGGTGVPGANGEGGEPMAYDEGAASRASGVAAGGAGGAAARGRDDQGGAGGLAGGGAPRLNASASSIKFQGMRRVSGTAGFRSISGRRGSPNKTIQTKGSSANSSSATRADGGPGGSAAAGGGGAGAGGVRVGRTAADGAAAVSASGGGGGGGGGSGGVDTTGIDDADVTTARIAELLGQAKSDREKAEDEKKKAMALKALGQDPQAAYHYDRYRKAKKAAEEKEAEADRMTAEMAAAAGQIPVTPDSGQ